VRHRNQGRKLGRTSAHRTAMLRNLVCSLFLAEPSESSAERVVTTKAKAKEAQRLAERIITLAKKGTLADRRRAIALLGNRKDAVSKAFREFPSRYEERAGGYTRVLQLSERRLGDNAPQAILELVGSEERSKSGTQRKRKKKAASSSPKAKPDVAVAEESAVNPAKEVAVEEETTVAEDSSTPEATTDVSKEAETEEKEGAEEDKKES